VQGRPVSPFVTNCPPRFEYLFYYLYLFIYLKFFLFLLFFIKISTPDAETDVDLVINIIQQLLFHAKVTYLKSYEQSHSFIELCDTYIGHVDLLQILVSSNCGQSVSLADLNEPSKARVLRDNLIRDDRLKLAMEVASKCRIETEPVWAAWGILKLKMGAYEEAKEKFKHTLGLLLLFVCLFVCFLLKNSLLR
jgi:hypothetical protein